jgi:malate dehydrogenase (oxaloacetate-decarboxylating)(NADP+)
MAAVDVTAIEAAMKQSSLDVLRGYSQDHYGKVEQYRTTDYVPKNQAGGYQVLREPAWNKGRANPSPKKWPELTELSPGTSFSPDERVSKNLTG